MYSGCKPFDDVYSDISYSCSLHFHSLKSNVQGEGAVHREEGAVHRREGLPCGRASVAQGR